MKDKNIKGDQEFEKKLRDKMNELSSGVDCFDKISARAFPEKDSDFSDSEFTVSDLENVTGRRRALPVLKWIAAAAAVVICVGILPHTAFVQNFLSNFRRNSDEKYRTLLSEIFEETEEHTYDIYDMTLKEYAENDVLVDPLYRCPFKNNEKEGVRVRIYVRRIKDAILTNQIYAVEYKGEFGRSSVIAAAKSKAEFTDKDIEDLSDEPLFGNGGEVYPAADTSFKGDRYGYMTDPDGNSVTVASYMYNRLFKDAEGIRAIETQVLYCCYKDSGKYCFDVLNTVYNEKAFAFEEVSIPEKLWKCSINYDGTNAMPDKSELCMERRDYFSDRNKGAEFSHSYFFPYAEADEDLLSENVDRLEKKGGEIAVNTPVNREMKYSMCIYMGTANFFQYSSQSDPTIDLYINGEDGKLTIHRRNLNSGQSKYYQEEEYTVSDDEQKEMMNQQEKEFYESISKELEIQRKNVQEQYVIQNSIEEMQKAASEAKENHN